MENQKEKLANKKILITGASRGIGKECAKALADCGAKLFLVSRNEKELKDLAKEIQGADNPVEYAACDLCQFPEIQRLTQIISQKWSNLDVLINNAGKALKKGIQQCSPQDWEECFSLNAKAPFFLSQALFPLLKKSADARIINIASVVAHTAYEEQSIYSASKHALLGLSKAQAKEYQDHGIRVHVISPGGVATEMVRETRPDLDPQQIIQSKDIAQSILYLLKLPPNCSIDEIRIRRSGKPPWL